MNFKKSRSVFEKHVFEVFLLHTNFNINRTSRLGVSSHTDRFTDDLFVLSLLRIYFFRILSPKRLPLWKNKRDLHIQGHSKDFWYNKGYASKRLEMYFYLYTMGFNTFQQSWKMFMNSVCLGVYLSVSQSPHSLSVENNNQMSWNF